MSVIIVARAGVGTINHSVLTIKYIESLGIKIKGIIINNYKEDLICDDNINMIEKMTKVPIIGKFKTMENLEDNMIEAIRTNAEGAFRVHEIIECTEQL